MGFLDDRCREADRSIVDCIEGQGMLSGDLAHEGPPFRELSCQPNEIGAESSIAPIRETRWIDSTSTNVSSGYKRMGVKVPREIAGS